MHTGLCFLTPSHTCLPVRPHLCTVLVLPPLRLPIDFSPRGERVRLSRNAERIETMDDTNALRLALLVRLQHTHARWCLPPYTMSCRACPCTPTSVPSDVGLRVCFCVSFACFVWSWSFHPTDFSTASETLLPVGPDEPDSDT
jgi:hypothetical protein